MRQSCTGTRIGHDLENLPYFRAANRFCRAGVFALIVAAAMLSSQAGVCQSMSGIRIGDDISSLSQLNTEAIAQQTIGPHTALKFELPDGNTLSVTYRTSTGKIVYLETDWAGKQSGSFSDFRDFRFGETTLEQIRSAAGHNGMGFLNGPGTSLTDDGGLVAFNSYDLAIGDLVVTFVTKVTKKVWMNWRERKATQYSGRQLNWTHLY